MSERLEQLLVRGASLNPRDTPALLRFLEEAALATEEADLGDEGARAALHLRAALGAFVRFSQLDVQQQSSATAALELQAVVSTLIARAQHTLLSALAARYDVLAKVAAEANAEEAGAEDAPLRSGAAIARDALREAAQAIALGEPVSAQTRDRLAEALRDVRRTQRR